jgi:hypothetical protein
MSIVVHRGSVIKRDKRWPGDWGRKVCARVAFVTSNVGEIKVVTKRKQKWQVQG